ncbi:MAG TPA: hypothetical protein VGM56_32165 [Byssovorax sp.]
MTPPLDGEMMPRVKAKRSIVDVLNAAWHECDDEETSIVLQALLVSWLAGEPAHDAMRIKLRAKLARVAHTGLVAEGEAFGVRTATKDERVEATLTAIASLLSADNITTDIITNIATLIVRLHVYGAGPNPPPELVATVAKAIRRPCESREPERLSFAAGAVLRAASRALGFAGDITKPTTRAERHKT